MEDEERSADGEDSDRLKDPFIQEGLSTSSEGSGSEPVVCTARGGSARLQAGKARREDLKARLFRAKRRRAKSCLHAQFA